MKFNKVLFGSVLTMAAFGLLACGDDSSSNASSGSEPSAPEYKPPVASATSPVKFTSISITPMQGATGMVGSLGGMIELDIDFVETSVPYTPAAVTQIDGVTFTVGKNENGKIIQEPITIDLATPFPAQRVALSQKTFDFSQLSSCGQFQLYIVASASINEAGLQSTPYTSLDTVNFVRPESECAAPVVESSSSAPAACTELTPVEITLSNSLGTSQSALNMETGLADNPDFTVKFEDGAAIVVPSAGVSVVEDDNTHAAGKIPAAPICLETFEATSYSVDEFSQNLWVIVTTAAGKQYPMLIGKVMKESSTKGSVVITYFK